jgi:hypothetical protein
MIIMSDTSTSPERLPAFLEPLLWDYDFTSLSWDQDRDLIIRRILQEGSWEATQWLRLKIGDDTLRAWLEGHRGGRLSPRQLRYWELVLEIDSTLINKWIDSAKEGPWEMRVGA